MKIFRVRYNDVFLAESKEDAIAKMRAGLGKNIICGVDVAECTEDNFRNYEGEWEAVACYLDGSKA